MTNTDDDKTLYKVADFSEMFKVSKQAIQHQLNINNVEAVKVEGRTKLYDKNALQLLTTKYVNNSKKDTEARKNVAASEVDSYLKNEILAQLTAIRQQLDADTASEVAEHVADLIAKNKADTANEYMNMYLDKVSSLTARIDDLVEQQKKLVDEIQKLQEKEEQARKTFKKMKWVNTQEAIIQSFEYYKKHQFELAENQKLKVIKDKKQQQL